MTLPHRTSSDATSSSCVTVVIPAFNEEEALPGVLNAIPRDVATTIIVCDNASNDDTARIAREHGAIVVHEKKRGYGSACLRALAAVPDDTDIVVFLDADHSDRPEEMPALLAPIANDELDLVIGSRVRRAEPDALMFRARFGNWLATRLIRLFFGFRYTDLGPFRAIRKTSLDTLGMRDPAMGWTIEMQLRALTHQLRIGEVDVSYRARPQGESKITGTVTGTIRAGVKILYLVFRYGLARR